MAIPPPPYLGSLGGGLSLSPTPPLPYLGCGVCGLLYPHPLHLHIWAHPGGVAISLSPTPSPPVSPHSSLTVCVQGGVPFPAAPPLCGRGFSP